MMPALPAATAFFGLVTGLLTWALPGGFFLLARALPLYLNLPLQLLLMLLFALLFAFLLALSFGRLLLVFLTLFSDCLVRLSLLA
jgi:hypothetical protein